MIYNPVCSRTAVSTETRQLGAPRSKSGQFQNFKPRISVTRDMMTLPQVYPLIRWIDKIIRLRGASD